MAEFSPAERIHALDGLRAVAMFLGIVLHAGMVYAVDLPLFGGGIDVSRHRGFDLLLAAIHGFRMQLFFLLCGFFARLLHQRLGTNGFVKQRLRRIGLPFILGMITVVPLSIAIAVWGFIREGQPVPALPASSKVSVGIPTIHLWFLLYLLCLYALALLAVKIGGLAPPNLVTTIDRVFASTIRSPWRYVVFAPATVVCLWTGPWWGEAPLPIFSVVPEFWTLAHYSIFAGVGWWLHRRREHLPELARYLKPAVFIAIGAFVLMTMFKPLETADAIFPNRFVVKTASLLCAAIYAWTMTFAITGVFLRYANSPRSWTRYLADASYWCYLAHMPVVMILQMVSSRWPWPALVKFTTILGVTMAFLLITYHFRVRYTWVGLLLNGTRDRPNSGVQRKS